MISTKFRIVVISVRRSWEEEKGEDVIRDELQDTTTFYFLSWVMGI